MFQEEKELTDLKGLIPSLYCCIHTWEHSAKPECTVRVKCYDEEEIFDKLHERLVTRSYDTKIREPRAIMI